METYQLAFVNSVDADQPVHVHSLIKIYTIHILLTQACLKIFLSCVDSDMYIFVQPGSNIACYENPYFIKDVSREKPVIVLTDTL